MDKIRCLIADMPHHLLADIIQKTTETYPEIEVIGQLENSDLLDVVTNEHVDALIVGMGNELELHTIAMDEIFSIAPNVVVIGIVDDGRRVCLCSEDIGPDLLMRMVCLKNKLGF